MAKKLIMFTGAGSGGHVITAIATVLRLRKTDHKLAKHIIYIGATNLLEARKGLPSLEEELCKLHKIPFEKIYTGKLRRRLSVRTLIDSMKIIIGFFDALRTIIKHRPKVIVSFGGYVSFPLIFWGKLLGSKIIIHEQTVNIGLANKLASCVADKILLTFKDSQKYIPKFKHENIEIVGYPLLDSLFKYRKFSKLKKLMKTKKKLYPTHYQKQLEYIHKSKVPLILVVGGSLGSHLINKTIAKIIPELVKKYIVIIQTGYNPTTGDYEKLQKLRQKLPKRFRSRLIVRKFIYDELGFLLNRANLVIGRSGAGFVYQTAVFRTPAIFIPIPWVTKNEQYENAKKLKDIGLASIILEKELTPQLLFEKINQVIREPPAFSTEILSREFKTDATDRIIRNIKELLNDKQSA